MLHVGAPPGRLTLTLQGPLLGLGPATPLRHWGSLAWQQADRAQQSQTRIRRRHLLSRASPGQWPIQFFFFKSAKNNKTRPGGR